jgi:NAD(P)-dependent dehydrogenase (short-subunit alcohol dehydrogenase family)
MGHAKTLAVALAPQGIRVNAVAPGSIEFPGGAWDRAKQGNRGFYDQVFQTIPWAGWGPPRKSPTSWRSWCRTGRAGSPVHASRWMEASTRRIYEYETASVVDK